MPWLWRQRVTVKMSKVKKLAKKLLALILTGCGVLSLSRWLRERLFGIPRITILCYHRIATQEALISPQCIHPVLFEKQISYFASHFHVISLDDVSAYLAGDVILDQDAVVITFDDGYEDNYTHAAPVLERYGIRATFFVASTPILDGQRYWIDELSALLDALHGSTVIVDVPALPVLAQQIARFIAIREEGMKAVATEIFLAVNQLDEVQKYTFLQALREACMRSGRFAGPTPALMSTVQIQSLYEAGHQIGAHTQTHPRLSNLDIQSVEDEIGIGVTRLRQRFGAIRHFAYPFGKLADLPADRPTLFGILQRCGFLLAVTTDDNVVASNDHRYLVPRKVMSAQLVAQIRLKMELMAWHR